MTTEFLGALLDGNGLGDYVMLGRKPVEDSSHPSILPLDAPIDQHEYDPDVHSPKSLVAFDVGLYMEIICVVALPAPAELERDRHGSDRLPPDPRNPAVRVVTASQARASSATAQGLHVGP